MKKNTDFAIPLYWFYYFSDPSIAGTWSKASSRYERETDDVLDNLEGRGDGYEQHTHTSACQHFERVDDTYEQAEDLNVSLSFLQCCLHLLKPIYITMT